VTDVRTYLTASAYLATRVRRTPLALSAHGSLPGSSGLRGRVKNVYDAALVRPMLRGAALLFAQTAHEARLYEQFGGRPEAIVQLPLPLPPSMAGTPLARGRSGSRSASRRRRRCCSSWDASTG
jgi:hypothetical protein